MGDATMREERYIAIPGSRTHELPPLLVHSAAEHAPIEGSGDLTSVMQEAEDMLAPVDASEEILEKRKLDLALQLTEQYKGLMAHWLWGDSVLEWIRQCQITFESEAALRTLLHPDVWPHASRASFVTLLIDKEVPTHGVALEAAVGLRLIFREPSPIRCLSNQFLFYLNGTVADTAYRTWSHLVPHETALLPPERFHFEVVDIGN
jgi:hypothetical protein